jgi:serine/threonine protein kinase
MIRALMISFFFVIRYSRKSDVWSFGCMIVELLSLKVPYANLDNIEVLLRLTKHAHNITDSINDGTENNDLIYPHIESQWPPNLQRFLKRMWCLDPHHRPLMKKIFEFCDKNHKLSLEPHE